jgi:hypothetical protein
MEKEQTENLKTYAHVLDGKVINVSLWSQEPILETDEELIEIPEGSTAGIDWDYVGGKFVDNRPVSELPGN